MYNYKQTESHDGSHFFVKTPNDSIIRISFFKPDEDYTSDYLEQNIRHLLVYNMSSIALCQSEAINICEVIQHIVYEFLAYNECILKIEVNNTCGKNIQIKKHLEKSPDDVRGFIKENLEDCILYFLFNKNKIESTDLLSSLIEEYKE